MLSVLLLAACTDSKQTGRPNPLIPEEEDEDTTYVTLAEAGGDSLLVGSTVYSNAERILSNLLYNVEGIQSTYMLQIVLGTYENDLQEAKKVLSEAEQSGNCSDEELATLHTTLDRIQQTLDGKMSQFCVPAVGVIGALKSSARSINNARTKADLERVLDGRRSYFQTLSTLHLIVQEPSKQREVHRLAKELQRALEQKQAELK